MAHRAYEVERERTFVFEGGPWGYAQSILRQKKAFVNVAVMGDFTSLREGEDVPEWNERRAAPS